LKSLDYYQRFYERFVTKFHEEELAAYKKACEDPAFTSDVQKDWLAYTNQDVYEYFPPQLIIGKQT
jgi:hypothetical protein